MLILLFLAGLMIFYPRLSFNCWRHSHSLTCARQSSNVIIGQHSIPLAIRYNHGTPSFIWTIHITARTNQNVATTWWKGHIGHKHCQVFAVFLCYSYTNFLDVIFTLFCVVYRYYCKGVNITGPNILSLLSFPLKIDAVQQSFWGR